MYSKVETIEYVVSFLILTLLLHLSYYRLPVCRLRLVYPMRLHKDHYQKEEFQATFQHPQAQSLVLIAIW